MEEAEAALKDVEMEEVYRNRMLGEEEKVEDEEKAEGEEEEEEQENRAVGELIHQVIKVMVQMRLTQQELIA